jgi:hypothetical protein
LFDTKRLALDERRRGDIPTVEMQEIESVIDKLHRALAVGGRLCLREARQSSVVDAAEVAVDVGGLHL